MKENNLDYLEKNFLTLEQVASQTGISEEEIKEQIEKSEMPLSSYTLIHRDAILSDAEKHMLINWSEGLRKQMEAKYPKDSLVRKRGPEPSNGN